MQTVRPDAPLHTDALRPAPVDPPPPPRWTASRDRAAVAAHGNHPINHLVIEPTRFADRDKAGRPRARTQRPQRSPQGDGDALSKRQPGPTHACGRLTLGYCFAGAHRLTLALLQGFFSFPTAHTSP